MDFGHFSTASIKAGTIVLDLSILKKKNRCLYIHYCFRRNSTQNLSIFLKKGKISFEATYWCFSAQKSPAVSYKTILSVFTKIVACSFDLVMQIANLATIEIFITKNSLRNLKNFIKRKLLGIFPINLFLFSVLPLMCIFQERIIF